MGSENLNRVFIKAYGKGGANTSAATSGPAASEPDAYMVRFDTATVAMPVPHLFSPPQKSAPVAPAVATPQAQPQTLTASIAPAASVAPHMHVANVAPQSEKELTAWDETMFSLLFGGATTVVAPNTVLAATKIQPVVNQAASSDGPNRSQQSAKTQPAPRNAPTKESALAEEMANRIASKNQGGEIFRLDKPSYAAETTISQGAEAYDEDDSPTALMMEMEQQVPATPPVREVQPMPSSRSREAMMDSHHRNLEKTKRREQALRQSRMKIFNPLWEVDRLQWPAVCVELSKTIDETSIAVIENLIKACQEGLQILAVTSPQSGEGTSTVACCMSMLAGKHGLNVALVDSNVENPSLSYQTNLELDVDWHEAVAKRMPLEEIAVHSVEDQVTLVPLLERLNAPELNEHNVAQMLQELSQSFDLVIVDLGNMSAQRNMVRKLGELGVINAVVAVVDRRLNSPDRIEGCLRQIRQTGIASIGLVENFAA